MFVKQRKYNIPAPRLCQCETFEVVFELSEVSEAYERRKRVSHHSGYFDCCYFCLLSAGELGVYLHDHLHLGVLPKDSGVRLSVPRRRLLAELLEHIGLCHCLHGVSIDLLRGTSRSGYWKSCIPETGNKKKKKSCSEAFE